MNDADPVQPAKPPATPGLAAQAHALRQAGQPEAALALLRNAPPAHRARIPVLLETAAVLIQLGQEGEAAETYAAILRAAPGNPQALRGLGRLARLRGDAAAAERAYLDLLALDGADAAALLALAQLAVARSDTEAAAAYATRALAHPPKDAGSRNELAKLLIGLARLDEAAAAIDAWLSDGSDPMLEIRRAEISCALGDTTAGLRQLRGLAATSLGQGASVALAGALNRQGAVAEATSVLRATVASHPRSKRAWSDLAILLHRQGEDDAALDCYRRVAAIDPADPQPWLESATLFEQTQRPDEARAILARLEASGDDTARELVSARRIEHACGTGRLDEAALLLGAWPDARAMPSPVVRWAAVLHDLRGDWQAVLHLLAERVVTGQGASFVPPDRMLLERILIAARRLGYQAQTLSLLERWPAARQPEVVALRQTLADDLQLLDLLHGNPAQPLPAPVDDVRASRRARLQAALMAPPPGVTGTILLCTDRAYLPGAAVALAALLRHNAAALRACRFAAVLDHEAMEIGRPVLQRLAAAHAVRLDIIDTAALRRSAAGLRVSWGYSSHVLVPALPEATYWRILAVLHLAEAGQGGRLLYLDSDTCPGPGVARLLRADMHGQPLAACLDSIEMQSVQRAARRLGVPAEAYFNSGILLFDLEHAALAAGLRRALDIAATSPEKLTNPDQCAMNLAFCGQATILPRHFNAFVRPAEPPPKGSRPEIIHYLSRPKPWDVAYPDANNDVWIDEFCALAELLPGSDLRALLAVPLTAATPLPASVAPSMAAPPAARAARAHDVAGIRALLDSGDIEGAEQAARALVARQPNDTSARALLARAANARGDTASALAVWLSAREDFATQPGAWQPGLAQALMQLGRCGEAAELYANIHAKRGDVAALAGQAMAVGQISPADAEALWQDVVRQAGAKAQPAWIVARARARQDAGDEAHALALLDDAMRGKAALPQNAYILRSRVLAALGRRDQLIDELDHGRLREGGGAGEIARCYAQFRLGRFDAARQSFDAAMGQPDSIWQLAQLLFFAPRMRAPAELVACWQDLRGRAAKLSTTARLSGATLHLRLDLALRDHAAFLERLAQTPMTPDKWSGRFARIAEKLRQPGPDFSAPKVFGIGLARTGTTSLGAALELLGYSNAHNNNPFTEALLDDADFPLFDAANDTPVTMRLEALDALYPNARFILTERPIDDWEASVNAYFGTWRGMPDIGAMRRLNGLDPSAYGQGLAAIDQALYLRHGDYRSAYAAHTKRVADHFAGRPGKLLRHNACAGDGWEKLCGFLGHALPGTPYPRENRGTGTRHGG